MNANEQNAALCRDAATKFMAWLKQRAEDQGKCSREWKAQGCTRLADGHAMASNQLLEVIDYLERNPIYDERPVPSGEGGANGAAGVLLAEAKLAEHTDG